MIIGLLGYKNVGKSTVAQYLGDLCLGLTNIAFADPMKRFAAEVYDWPMELLDGPSEGKEIPDPRYVRIGRRTCDRFVFALDGYGASRDERGNPRKGPWEAVGLTPQEFDDWQKTGEVHLTPRFALQQLGTEWGRNCYVNTWADLGVRTAQRHLAEGRATAVVITDCRFSNEVAAIQRVGGQILKITRPGCGPGSHGSEREQDDLPFDTSIPNDESLAELHERLREFSVRASLTLR